MSCTVHAELSADEKSIVLAFTGDDYELDAAAKALKRLTALTEPTDPPSGMRTTAATWATVTQLAFTFNGGPLGQWRPRPRLRAWIEAEFLRRHVVTAYPADVLMPAGLTPRPYQYEGAAMIAATGKVLLFDEAGVGKTCSTLLGLKARQLTHDIFPLLIVTPSWDVAQVWADHIREWAPEWPEPVMYSGPERAALLDGQSAGKNGNRFNSGAAAGERGANSVPPVTILITTYATMRRDAADAKGPLVRLKARAVVFDESHGLKNENSKQSLAGRRVAAHAGTFVALSGTPVTRDTGDIFPVLAAMDPASWPSRERFVKRYCETSDNGYGETVEGLKALAEPEFRALLAGQYRRVSKADVLPQLPPKTYSLRRVEIPPEWRKSYDAMQEDMLAELPDGSEISVMSVLAQLTRLGQLASSACDVEVSMRVNEKSGELEKHYTVTLRAPSWKADALLGILAERPGQQVAVFGVSKQLVLIAGEACEKAGYRCGYITGGQSKGSRRDSIAAFQAGEADVILATAGAGGLGITLTAASTVVVLQRSWELDKAVQIEDRAHRLGQRHVVEVIDVLAKGTIDDRVRELMRVKGRMLSEIVGDVRLVKELLGGLR